MTPSQKNEKALAALQRIANESHSNFRVYKRIAQEAVATLSQATTGEGVGDVQEEFEKFVRRTNGTWADKCLTRGPNGTYNVLQTWNDWIAWQACWLVRDEEYSHVSSDHRQEVYLVLNEFAQKVRAAKDIDEVRTLIASAERILSVSIPSVEAIQETIQNHATRDAYESAAKAVRKLIADRIETMQLKATPVGGEVVTEDEMAEVATSVLSGDIALCSYHGRRVAKAIHALIQSRVGGR